MSSSRRGFGIVRESCKKLSPGSQRDCRPFRVESALPSHTSSDREEAFSASGFRARVLLTDQGSVLHKPCETQWRLVRAFRLIPCAAIQRTRGRHSALWQPGQARQEAVRGKRQSASCACTKRAPAEWNRT